MMSSTQIQELTRDQLIYALKKEQSARCAYGTREGDGKTCDCKFHNLHMSWYSSEATGCPELRAAIWLLEGKL